MDNQLLWRFRVLLLFCFCFSSMKFPSDSNSSRAVSWRYRGRCSIEKMRKQRMRKAVEIEIMCLCLSVIKQKIQFLEDANAKKGIKRNTCRFFFSRLNYSRHKGGVSFIKGSPSGSWSYSAVNYINKEPWYSLYSVCSSRDPRLPTGWENIILCFCLCI